MRYIIFFSFIFQFFTCKKNETIVSCFSSDLNISNEKKVTISSGIWGTITFTEGNCMPTIGITTSCKTYPVKREIRFYEYTKISQATINKQNSSFYDNLNTKLITSVYSDECGFYQLTIPAGKYSVVIVENNSLYANLGDGQGGINPVLVESNSIVQHNVSVNYKAVY